jgi:hypothetical protein
MILQQLIADGRTATTSNYPPDEREVQGIEEEHQVLP